LRLIEINDVIVKTHGHASVTITKKINNHRSSITRFNNKQKTSIHQIIDSSNHQKMNIIIYISIVLISIGIFLSFIRFVKGPTTADRAIALDTLSVIGIAGLVLLGYLFKRYIYIDLALVYAVLGFIGIIVIARYIEKAL